MQSFIKFILKKMNRPSPEDMNDMIMSEQREEIKKLKEENKTLKDNIEFLHQCLDDRDKSIEIMKEKLDKLRIELVEVK